VDELGAAAGATVPADAAAADAVTALTTLGYTRTEAESAVAKTRQAFPDAGVEVLLRESLKRI
jgi:Holliday junction resolvasome RuvABC DNA-binding subunit